MASVEQAPAAEGEATGIPVENPATGETIAVVPTLDEAQVRDLVARARAAQPAWEALGFEERGRILRRMQRWVLDHRDRIIATIVSETGKTYEDALFAEIMYAASAFGHWAKMAPRLLADERVRTANPVAKGKKLVVRHRPVGVVGVIGPWNFPLTNSFGDCIPALAAGNAVVLKPSEVTPLTSLLLADGLRACGLPDDVFHVATGDGTTGAALIDHVDYLMFTGSTATGRKVAEQAARSLTPVGLELGGNDPMIVLVDADLERAANAAVYYGMNNGGQVCISVERVYVEEPVYDAFVAKVTEKVRALRQGRSTGPGTAEVGAVTFPRQVEVIEAHVADAVAKGARVVTGGRAASGPGRFFEPTVIADADHSMACMREETFGPMLPIMPVADAEEAVRLANDSPYGLQASVWTRDVRRGERIARRLEVGAVCVNDAQVNYTVLEVPMGGWKTSGLGSRHGAEGIRKYTRPQTVLVTRLAGSRDPYMFPYRARTTRLIARLTRLLYGRGRRA